MEIIKIPNFINEREIKIIEHEVLSNEEKIKEMGESKSNLVDGDSLTGRYYLYNFLTNNPSVKQILFDKFVLMFGLKRFVKLWANTYYKGQGFNPHVHRNPQSPQQKNLKDWTCGHIFISGPLDVGITYAGERHTSTPGELHLFRSDLPHYVPRNETDDVRITLAFDVFLQRTLKVDCLLK